MPTINISIQSSIDSFDHGNQIRKMNERHLNWKGELKVHPALSPAPPEASLWHQVVWEGALALPTLSLTELLLDPTTAWGVVLGAGGHGE